MSLSTDDDDDADGTDRVVVNNDDDAEETVDWGTKDIGATPLLIERWLLLLLLLPLFPVLLAAAPCLLCAW